MVPLMWKFPVQKTMGFVERGCEMYEQGMGFIIKPGSRENRENPTFLLGPSPPQPATPWPHRPSAPEAHDASPSHPLRLGAFRVFGCFSWIDPLAN